MKAVPHHWKWKDLLPVVEKSGELVSMNDSERRTLILMNPALAPTIATVTTMYAGYRINLPNETAPAHRHSPNAVRLGLTGVTNFTAVEGEHIGFGPGDLVMTPHDCWHSHGNEGSEPAINISYLDHPLCNTLNATYFNSDLWVEENGKKVKKDVQDEMFPRNYSVNTYRRGGLMSRSVSHLRGTGNASPMYIYRWDYTREFLEEMKSQDGSPYDGIMLEYTDPTTGGPVYPTMTFLAQLLRPGEKTVPIRQTASLICSILEGSGRSVVGDKTFDWDKFDTFCVPGGEWYQHHNNTDKTRSSSSRPMSRHSRRSSSSSAIPATSTARWFVSKKTAEPPGSETKRSISRWRERPQKSRSPATGVAMLMLRARPAARRRRWC